MKLSISPDDARPRGDVRSLSELPCWILCILLCCHGGIKLPCAPRAVSELGGSSRPLVNPSFFKRGDGISLMPPPLACLSGEHLLQPQNQHSHCKRWPARVPLAFGDTVLRQSCPCPSCPGHLSATSVARNATCLPLFSSCPFGYSPVLPTLCLPSGAPAESLLSNGSACCRGVGTGNSSLAFPHKLMRKNLTLPCRGLQNRMQDDSQSDDLARLLAGRSLPRVLAERSEQWQGTAGTAPLAGHAGTGDGCSGASSRQACFWGEAATFHAGAMACQAAAHGRSTPAKPS